MPSPSIPASGSQAVQTVQAGGTIPFVVQWWNFFSGLVTGITDGSNAPAGQIGEYLSSIVTVASGVSVPNSLATLITSLVLTAGDWELWGEVAVGVPSVGPSVFASGALSSLGSGGPGFPSTSQFPADGSAAADYSTSNTTSSALVAVATIPLGPMRVNITTNTTFFLNAFVNYGAAGTCLVGGAIRARRRR